MAFQLASWTPSRDSSSRAVTAGSVWWTPAMPHAFAAAMFASTSSMNTHSPGSRPSVAAACRKISGSGLRMPTSPEITTVSNRPGKSARGYSSHPHELDSSAVLNPAPRSVLITRYMAGTGRAAENMRLSSPSATTGPPAPLQHVDRILLCFLVRVLVCAKDPRAHHRRVGIPVDAVGLNPRPYRGQDRR